MGSRRRRWVVGWAILLSAVMVTTGHTGVQACSIAPVPDLDELRAGESAGDFDTSPVIGVYEYETIARSPGLFGDRSITTVTRYWGEAPDDVGLRVVTPGCGRTVSDAGTVGYWWVSTSERRFRSSLTLGDASGTLTAEQEAVLVERFGRATTLDVSRLDRVLASARAWQWELIAFAVVGGVGLLVLARVRGAAHAAAPERAAAFDRPVDRRDVSR